MGAEGSSGPVAILAGSGEFPLLLADRLAAAGRETRILAFRGFASRAVRARADASVGLLDAKGTLSWLERCGPDCVTLAGGLRRPDPGALLDAYSALRSRAELRAILARGDDNLLRAAIGLLEERGFRLVGLTDLAPELLAPAGALGTRVPDEASLGSVRIGMELLRKLSSFDVGQAAVLAGDRVLAIEGPEGTDRMLARARALRRRGFLRRPERGGVLVKAPKEGQDLRVDLPAIGPRTMVNAARAGLSGVAVASGLSVVLDRAETVRMADRLGLFLFGAAGRGT
ncbi:LpxI family protein [Enterovirga aerilata]|uniref:UDP-2,3-diacylglucosamine diphosphatase LpxI n=1 Tax=Enterovirga aerilata TaxID=2730920 RepID=A0A849I7V4_9HYPH|nr:UDP-2,3-diacylglucosamine diphosphatase LpxI [Enterovirga sp. DB1703]NNM72489.1 UDP-2,3-diacylglucosamine diphosphatase LpxI [Enterovirga sp. DB1703]